MGFRMGFMRETDRINDHWFRAVDADFAQYTKYDAQPRVGLYAGTQANLFGRTKTATSGHPIGIWGNAPALCFGGPLSVRWTTPFSAALC